MSDQTVNESEAFVLRLCQKSILSPWCYNNPRGKDGDELCHKEESTADLMSISWQLFL
ncbi:MAG: hypothetical protein QOF78_2275 [Phycisphaerales bacterium]|jgi:hypothetical protein|nr:hypothetical protein [Phycisphaerales bacterium]